MAFEFLLKLLDVNKAVECQPNSHSLGGRFAPHQVIGVVLIGTDKHHGALKIRYLVAKMVALIEC